MAGLKKNLKKSFIAKKKKNPLPETFFKWTVRKLIFLFIFFKIDL